MENEIKKGTQNQHGVCIKLLDTLIVIPKDRLMDKLLGNSIELPDFIKKNDAIVRQAVKDITDCVCDIDTDEVIGNMVNITEIPEMKEQYHIAYIGIGYGAGKDKYLDAAKMAIDSPMFGNVFNEAAVVTCSVSGDLEATGANACAEYISQAAGKETEEEKNFYIGINYDENMADACIVTVIVFM